MIFLCFLFELWTVTYCKCSFKSICEALNSVRLFLTLLNTEFFREETSNAEHNFYEYLPSKMYQPSRYLGTETGHQRTFSKEIPWDSNKALSWIPWINEVELFHPTVADLPFGSCERCSKGFQSVASAGVTLFQQIVAGDPGATVPCCQMRLRWILGFNAFLLLQWWWTKMKKLN